jgi:signal peptidase II
MNRKLPYLFLALTVVVLDQWTKWLVEVHLPRGAAEPVVPGFLNLVHVKNTGVAFGLFASDGGSTSWTVTLLGLAALAAVGLYFRFTPPHDRLLLAALGAVAGGAVGNLLDRAMAGSVTDFVDVYAGSYHWPAFNVADSAITLGIGLMVLDVFRRRHPEGREAAAEA